MVEEVVASLAPAPGAVMVDCTFGRGGHSKALLERVRPGGRVIALDQDPEAVRVGTELAARERALSVRQASFAELDRIATAEGVRGRVNGVLIDLGVSSPQLDDAARGFSFRHDGPLDMRMDPARGPSAAEWLAGVGEAELARTLRVLGEEPAARRIARAIVRARAEAPIETTGRLAEVVTGAIPAPGRRRRHPATRAFQAIRMAVNDELGELEAVLPQALGVLAEGGRLAVLTFHSLEDRMVKRFIRDPLGRGPTPRHLPIAGDDDDRPLRAVGKALRPRPAEVEANPRARSARLRVAERCAA